MFVGRETGPLLLQTSSSSSRQVQWQLGNSLLQDTNTLRELQQDKMRSWPLHWDKPSNLGILLPSVPSTGRPKTECHKKKIPSEEILKSASAWVPATRGQIFLTVSGWVIPLRAAVWIKWAIFDPKKSGFVLTSTEEHFLSFLFRIKQAFEAAWTRAGEFQWFALIEKIYQYAPTNDHEKESKLVVSLAVLKALASTWSVKRNRNNCIHRKPPLHFLICLSIFKKSSLS